MPHPTHLYLYQLRYLDGQFLLDSHESPCEPCEKNGRPAVRLTGDIPQHFLIDHVDSFGRRIYMLDDLDEPVVQGVTLSGLAHLGAGYVGVAWGISQVKRDPDDVRGELRRTIHDALLEKEREYEDAMMHIRAARRLAKPGAVTLYLHVHTIGVGGFDTATESVIVERKDDAFVGNALLRLPSRPGQFRRVAKIPYDEMSYHQHHPTIIEPTAQQQGRHLFECVVPSLLEHLPSNDLRRIRNRLLEHVEMHATGETTHPRGSSSRFRRYVRETLDAVYAAYGGKTETCRTLGHSWQEYLHVDPGTYPTSVFDGEQAGICRRCGEMTHPEDNIEDDTNAKGADVE